MDKKMVNAAISALSDEEFLDYIISELNIANARLDPSESESTISAAYDIGTASARIENVRDLLRAYRDKKYGQKPLTVL